MTATPIHPDPFRNLDAQADPAALIQALEQRGQTPAHARLLRRFLRFARIGRGQQVLEVGCGTGVVVRALAPLVAPAGRIVGIDPSRRVLDAARALCRRHPGARRIALRVADGTRLPFAAERFDAALAITVVLHVADPGALVGEMARVVRPGGRVGLQDQDFGTVALSHPDQPLTDRIMNAVAAAIYEEPHSGRRLTGLLRAAGLERVRLLTDVYQDTTLTPYTRVFIERRAENAVRFGVADRATVERWLDGFNALVAAGAFVMTLNFFGAVGEKPGRTRARR